MLCVPLGSGGRPTLRLRWRQKTERNQLGHKSQHLPHVPEVCHLLLLLMKYTLTLSWHLSLWRSCLNKCYPLCLPLLIFAASFFKSSSCSETFTVFGFNKRHSYLLLESYVLINIFIIIQKIHYLLVWIKNY